MNRKKWITAIMTAVFVTVRFPMDIVSASVQLVPVAEGITLPDRTGQLYIHVQNQDALHVTIDKTEPEGIFRYYDAELTGTAGQTETVYQMDLSRCEYLVGTGEYASQYTLSISAAADPEAVYIHDFIIQDPDFETASGSAYHYYVTLEKANESGYRLQSSQENLENGVLTCRQILVLQYFVPLTGDTDNDGAVTLSDASGVLRYYAEKSAGIDTEINMQTADTDKNGVINLADASRILSYYAQVAAGMSPSWDDLT